MAKYEATAEEKERISYWVSRATKMKLAKDRYANLWPSYEKIFRMTTDSRPGEDAWPATLPDTWSYATIKTAQAAFNDSRVLPVFKYHEEDDHDRMKSQDLRDLYLDIAEKGNLDQELYFARLDAFKLGVGFLKTVYVEEPREIHEIKSFNPDTGEIKYQKKTVKDFDDPKTVRVSPYFVLVDELAKADFQTARDLVELEFLHYDDAKRIYAKFLKGGEAEWDERIPKGVTFQLVEPLTGPRVAETADTNTGTDKPGTRLKEVPLFAPIDLAEDMVQMMHCWNRIDDTYELIANGEAVKVRTSKDPSPIPYIHKQIPFEALQYSIYSGDEFWAAGIVEIGLAEGQAIKKHREMMTDRQKVALFTPMMAEVGSEIDKRQLRLRPLSIIYTRGGKPTPLQIPGLANADLELVRNHEEAFKRAVGVDERILGASTDRLRLTATEIGLLRESSLRRLREFLFLYKNALIREVKFKIKLFEQYYASPLKREKRIVGDTGVKRLKVQAKAFKIKLGTNAYKSKEVYVSLFEGDIDMDLDMQTLVPMTRTEQATIWAQLIRDTAPVTQILGISLEKLYSRYIYAIAEIDLDSIREDKASDSIKAAEGEHRLLSSPATSEGLNRLLPEGTPDQFLTPEHLRRHLSLMEADDDIEDAELANLEEHIKRDQRRIASIPPPQQPQAPSLQPEVVNQIGGLGQPNQPQPVQAAQPQ